VTVDEALPTFIAEAAELLREMELVLLECTDVTPDADNVNRLFRCAHTIKGSSGLFGLDAIVAFVHNVEAVLDRVRLGQASLDSKLIGVLLKCKDHIESLVAGVAAGEPDPAPTLRAQGELLLQALGGDAHGLTGAPQPTALPVNSTAAAQQCWHISVRFGRDVLVAGMDPIGFLRYLGSFGSITELVLIDDALPGVAEFEPEKCYIGFEIAFTTDAPRERIEGTFDFVRDDCRLQIVAPASAVTAYFEALRANGLDDVRCVEVLRKLGSLSEAQLELGLRPAETQPVRAATTPVSVGHPIAVGLPGNVAQPGSVSPPKADSRSVRVDAAKLDSLITHIGELITAAATANLVAKRSGNRELEECTASVSALIEQVREGSLQLRMVKIGATFNRFRRVVHDLSAELGKEIELLVSGEDTELDKTVVERITDPLTHLVRNAIDHGIEAAETRTQRGKPAAGTIKLNAFHESGTIVIEVSDDGGGLKRDRILTKAIERGLVAPNAALSEAEIFNLVFEPGFSTAEVVTNLSGRGVGMDVVKRNITALRGDVSIRSAEGAGTTVTVRLPLTLAIINGFQVGVGQSIFVLPLESIEECVEFSATPGHDFTSLRGEVLPFVRLQSLFGTGSPSASRQSIVVVRNAGQRAGLVVDSLLGEFQTVIKPLGKIFQKLDCVSGSSILGTGEVALILDVPALVAQTVQRARASAPAEASVPLAVLS
jgi:two-component system, chemotaxis family, sensor kinase CheA